MTARLFYIYFISMSSFLAPSQKPRTRELKAGHSVLFLHAFPGPAVLLSHLRVRLNGSFLGETRKSHLPSCRASLFRMAH